MNYPSEKKWWGHPMGLFYLFFAELWERFSFYGMRALLVLYMTKKLLYEDDMAFGVYAAYMSLVYFTPLIGGMISDRYLGYRKSILWGGIIMALGHFFLSIETPFFFYMSLGLIIVGNGLFKPNISSFVGGLYEKGSALRDSGFTIFYMGINIGGAVAPLLCAYVAEKWGWHAGFVLAGIGMLAGLLFFNSGLKKNIFGEIGKPPSQAVLDQSFFSIRRESWIIILAFLSTTLFAGIVYFHEFEHYLVWLASFFIIGILVYIYRQVEKEYRSKLLVIAYFTVLMSLFWAIFEQAGSSLTLFADRNVNLVGMNAAQTNSINSTFIIFLAVPFSMLWMMLSKRKMNPNSAIKVAIGMIFLGLGFLVFGASAQSMDAMARTPMWYLIVAYFVLTVGEMFISPIGLSKMTELAPVKYLAFIMGVFFTSSFYGHFFAGKISKLTDLNSSSGNPFTKGLYGQWTEFITGMSTTSASQSEGFAQLYSYTSVYACFGLFAILVGIFALIISPIIRKWMREVH